MMDEVMKIKMEIVAEVRDGKTGKVKERIVHPCHTFLSNFSNLAVLVFQRGDVATSRTVTDVGGTSRTVRNHTSGITDYTAGTGYKIVCRIGTDNTAFDRDHYDVQTFLAELEYSEYDIQDDGVEKLLKITFAWTNDTGSAKDVWECLMAIRYNDSGDTVRKVGIARDVFLSAINVPNGDVLALGYWITIPW